MNKRIDLTNLGGYPLAQEDLEWLQSSYRNAFAGLASMIGDKVIVSGMVQAGGNVTNGWISLNGELLPFIGGTIGLGGYVIEQTETPLVFDDGVSKNVLIERVAKFSAGGTYQYSELSRPGKIKNIWCLGDQKPVNCTALYITTNFDSTGKGIAGTEREGWAICNGGNGTEDLRGLFLVGYDDRSVDPSNGIWDAVYNTIGGTGGEKKHTLTPDEFNHRHHITGSNFGDNAGNGSMPASGNNFTSDVEDAGYTDYVVGGRLGTDGGNTAAPKPHENRPPFKVKLFIEKIAA
jgi:hypothetical protein